MSAVNPLTSGDPAQIGPFVLLGRLGSGAMGRVFLGRSASGRLVAVKTLRPELADDPDFRARFGHEVVAAGRVSGGFTASVVAADPEAETPWLATVYIPAPDLRHLVRVLGPLPVAAVRWLGAGCAEALASIHDTGLVHRDFKPSNVLVTMDGPRVIDFGVTQAAGRTALTLTNQPVGTPAFMSPEQASDGRNVTAAADVFSLGSTLVYAATSQPPYRGTALSDLLVSLATRPPDLSEVPPELVPVLAACLSRDPRDRPRPDELLAEFAATGEGRVGETLARSVLPHPAIDLIERHSVAPETPPAFDDETFGSTGVRRSDDRSFASVSEGVTALRFTRMAGSSLSSSGFGLLVSAALTAVGLVLGAWLFTSDVVKPPQTWTSPPASAQAQRTSISLNQPYGDGNSVFVLSGSGWKPGLRVTISIQGSATSPFKPIVDDAGKFSYAVNQTHEFWPGRIPPGQHVLVAESTGIRHTVAFRVLEPLSTPVR